MRMFSFGFSAIFSRVERIEAKVAANPFLPSVSPPHFMMVTETNLPVSSLEVGLGSLTMYMQLSAY